MRFDPAITITNRRLLRMFGYNPKAKGASVTQPLSYWIRCAWWRLTGR